MSLAALVERASAAALGGGELILSDLVAHMTMERCAVCRGIPSAGACGPVGAPPSRQDFWSGLEGQLLTNELADILNLPPGALGYIVKTVAKGSPADAMGIRGGTTTATIDGQEVVVGGDIVLSVEGIALGTATAVTQIRQRLTGLSRGSPFKASVLRKGQVLELTGQVP